MLTVNGQEAEPGCYIAGHYGQYGLDQLAEVAEQFDIDVPRGTDPRWWRKVATEEAAAREAGVPRPDDAWEEQVYAADRLEEQLNELTEGGYWSWEDGEFFLTQTEVERWLYVTDSDYDAAWQQVLEANVNEHCGYTDQYQATELNEDSDLDEQVYAFKITVHYEPERG